MTDDDTYPLRPPAPSPREERLRARAVMWRRLAVGTTVVAVLLILCATAYTAYTIRKTQVDSVARAKSTNSAAKAARAAADRIEECTTPGRSCYERGQGQITSAVVDVNRVTVVAAACADQSSTQSVAEIRACVLRGLSDPTTAVPRRAAPGAGTSSTTKGGAAGSSGSIPKPKSLGSSGSTSTPTPAATPSPRPSGSPSSPATPHLICLEPLTNLCVL